MASIHECKHCFQRFDSKTQVAKHMYLHKQGHICTKCNKPFASESGLKRHMNANHSQNQANFKCTICDSNFRLKRDFEKHHLSEHRANKHFKCKQCGATFSWLINLVKHEKFHSGQNNEVELVKDTLVEPTKENLSCKKLYQCDICNKKFNFDFTYAIHLAGHEKSKNNLANKSLDESLNNSHSEDLESQAPTENEEQVMNYIPSEEENKDLFEYLKDCRNRREGKLKRKKKEEVIYDFVMTKDKPFKCTQCDESFRWQVSLDIHLKVHSGDKTLKVRKPYSSSKMLLADKTKKKSVSENDMKQDKNLSKIVYQNESDEDNNYVNEDLEDETDNDKNKKNAGDVEYKIVSKMSKSSDKEENENLKNDCFKKEKLMDSKETPQTEDGLDPMDILNSIVKLQKS